MKIYRVDQFRGGVCVPPAWATNSDSRIWPDDIKIDFIFWDGLPGRWKGEVDRLNPYGWGVSPVDGGFNRGPEILVEVTDNEVPDEVWAEIARQALLGDNHEEG